MNTQVHTKPIRLLDTNIISAHMRQPTGTAAQHMVQALHMLPDAQLCTSVIVDAELRYGLCKINSRKLTTAYETTLSSLLVLPFTSEASIHYGNIRAYLESQGTPIGPNDLLIAAHARCLQATLVTDKEFEFNRVPGLKIDNWLR